MFNHESPRRGLNFVTAKVVKGALDIKNGNRQQLKLGNLDSTRDWGHAKDYVRAMWMILQHHKPDDFVVATGKEYTVRYLCEYVFLKTGLGDYRDYVVLDGKYIRPFELNNLQGNPSRIKNELGWQPEYTF